MRSLTRLALLAGSLTLALPATSQAAPTFPAPVPTNQVVFVNANGYRFVPDNIAIVAAASTTTGTVTITNVDVNVNAAAHVFQLHENTSISVTISASSSGALNLSALTPGGGTGANGCTTGQYSIEALNGTGVVATACVSVLA
jgi:hypothetical protein